MANTLATPTWVMNEVALGFLNEIQFLRNVKRTYDSQYKQAGANVGDTVFARLPQQWQVTDGQALQVQPLLDQTVPISLTNQKNIAWSYSRREQTTQLDEVRERYAQPAAETLANAADILAYNAVYRDVYNAVGVPGTTPSTKATYLQAGVKLTDTATPRKGRVAVLDTLAMATIADTTTTLFNPGGDISSNYKDGQLGSRQLGIGEWFEDSNRPVFTTGAFTTSTPLVNGSNLTGSTIDIDGWASGASTLNKGDIITMAGVNSVNPLSKADTGRLQQFVVTATTSDGSGEMLTLPISPSIITSGPLQTVTASPANNAVVLVWSTASGGALTATSSPVSMVYHPDAFAFVMADLADPGPSAVSKRISSKQFNIAFRWVEQYQIGNDQKPSRLDMLIGAATVQARLACRVQG